MRVDLINLILREVKPKSERGNVDLLDSKILWYYFLRRLSNVELPPNFLGLFLLSPLPSPSLVLSWKGRFNLTFWPETGYKFSFEKKSHPFTPF